MAIISTLAPSVEEAEAYTKNYTPSVQEQATETPDEAIDKTPATEAEIAALHEGTADTFQPLIDNQPNERAPEFQVPGEWVSPKVRAQRKRAMLMPPMGSINDLDQRISAVTRFANLPKEVSTLAQKARLSVGAAREAHEAGQHPENRRFAISQAAKDAVILETAKATTAVAALEAAADDPAIHEAWFGSLVGDLDKQRADALKALKAAERAYSVLRSNINAAQALAVKTGKWGKDWHRSPVAEHELNAPIASLRTAVDFLENGDDVTTGRFLTEEYDGFPPHTIAALKRAGDLSGGGSFAAQVFLRAVDPASSDEGAQDALREKDLYYLVNSSPVQPEPTSGRRY